MSFSVQQNPRYDTKREYIFYNIWNNSTCLKLRYHHITSQRIVFGIFRFPDIRCHYFGFFTIMDNMFLVMTWWMFMENSSITSWCVFGETANAWNAWLSYPHLTGTFIALLEDPKTLDLYPGHMEHLESFTVLMYSKSCNSGSVN